MHWYKCNMHMHSFWSDGLEFPEMVADWFKQHGYHFVAFTEHDRFQEGDLWISSDPNSDRWESVTLAHTDCIERYRKRFGNDWVQTRQRNGATEYRVRPMAEYRHLLEEPEKFLILAGEESTQLWTDNVNEAFYINVYNHRQSLGPQNRNGPRSELANQTYQSAQAVSKTDDLPALVSFNHPNWSYSVTAEDIVAADSIRFMEAYTALESCHVLGDERHASAERIWDIVLTRRLAEAQGPIVYGMVSDDCHFYLDQKPSIIKKHGLPANQSGRPGHAWMMVGAKELSEPAIYQAIDRGRFYGSTGITLRHLKADAQSIELEIDPVEGAHYTTQFIGTLKDYDPTSRPVRDDQGNPMVVTRQYSNELGRVLAESDGLSSRYELTGDEIYVRARITSDLPHPLPNHPGDVQRAWVQPVTRV